MNTKQHVFRFHKLVRGFFVSISIGATVMSSLTASARASTDGPATLPLVYVNSSMANTPAPGARKIVAAGTNLQTVLNNAHCGDTLLLQAGTTFSGNYYLPAKGCDNNHWIVLRTSAPDSALPPEGTRISPCYAGVASLPGRPRYPCSTAKKIMATLVASTAGPITLGNGSNHYRLGPGLEITRPVSSSSYNNLIAARGTSHNIVVDRDWIHGISLYDTMRGIMLSGMLYAAIVDSYINDFHCAALIGSCVDSQAVAGGTGSRPQGVWKIHNNFLEAAAENIMFGGVLTNSITPADIEITNNHIFKPLNWMPGQPGSIGMPNTDSTKCVTTPGYCPFIVKNLFELKNAQRVLLEGNILEYNWPGFSQHGEAILVNGLNPSDGTLSTISVMNVTMRYNHTSHTASVFALANPGPNNLPIGHISIHDNIFDDVSPAYQNKDTTGAFAGVYTYCSDTTCGNRDIVIDHNTELITQPSKWFAVAGAANGPISNWTYTNNIVSLNSGIAVINAGSTGCADEETNTARITACFYPFVMTHNALIGATGTWPYGNYFPASPAAVEFTNYNNANGGDYTLRTTSPYHNQGTDGKDLGANINAVNVYTQGVR